MAGDWLELKVLVDESTGDAALAAYDTVSYSSRLELQISAGSQNEVLSEVPTAEAPTALPVRQRRQHITVLLD